MKKVFYVIMAVSMSIITFILSPIHSYAAGTTTTGSLAMNDNFTFNVQYDSQSDGFTDGLENAHNAEFDFSISLRFTKPADNGQSPHYSTGHIWAYVTIPMTFNAALIYGSWTYSYEIDYAQDKNGVSSCVPLVRHGTQSLIIYYYAYLDNASFQNASDTVSQATVNFHITAPLTSQSANIVPTITFGSATLSSNGVDTSWSTDPSPYTGWSRVINLATEKAIINALDYAGFDDLMTYMYSIYILFPQYMDNILSALSQHNSLLSDIKAYVIDQYNQDHSFYIEVLRYLRMNQTEASEAVQEATQVQEVASSMAAELQQTQPDISEAFSYIDGQVDTQKAQQVFSFLNSGSIITTIMLITMCLAIMGYVLYGRR